jgi:hypothetical protein
MEITQVKIGSGVLIPSKFGLEALAQVLELKNFWGASLCFGKEVLDGNRYSKVVQ